MANTTLYQKINYLVDEFTSSYITLLKNDKRLSTDNYRRSDKIAQQILETHTHTSALRSSDDRIKRLSLEYGNNPKDIFLIYNSRLRKALREIEPSLYFTRRDPVFLTTISDTD